MSPDDDHPPDPDERVSLPLDPEVALKALLAVDPDDDGIEDSDSEGPAD